MTESRKPTLTHFYNEGRKVRPILAGDQVDLVIGHKDGRVIGAPAARAMCLAIDCAGEVVGVGTSIAAHGRWPDDKLFKMLDLSLRLDRIAKDGAEATGDLTGFRIMCHKLRGRLEAELDLDAEPAPVDAVIIPDDTAELTKSKKTDIKLNKDAN